MPSLRPLLAVALLSFLSPVALAQIPNASDTTATPYAGAGHDYLHSPVETVNPANGSVSIRVPVRMPQGRQITVPFSFAYDSNGAFYFGPPPQGGGPKCISIGNNVNTLGGWSYAYPVLSFSGGQFTSRIMAILRAQTSSRRSTMPVALRNSPAVGAIPSIPLRWLP